MTLQVGQTDRGGTLSVTSLNSVAEGGAWICRHDDDPTGPFPACAGAEGLVLTPSCGAQAFNALCRPGAPGPPPFGADPDVFAIHSSATGQSGACIGIPFTTVRVPGSFGKVRFDPPPGVHIVLVEPGHECTIRFSFDVLRVPGIDRRPDLPGLQTTQVAEATEHSEAGGLGSGVGSPSPVTVLPAPPVVQPPAPPPTASGQGNPPPATTAGSAVPPPAAPSRPPGCTPRPGPAIAGSVLCARGTATMTGPRACQRLAFKVRVSGRQIARVLFTLDGRRVGALTKPNLGTSSYRITIDPRKLTPKAHTVLTRVTFNAASGTPPRTLRFRFTRCRAAKVVA